MRVIIAAAGEGTRWADYLGVPKHIVRTAAGETLLVRTLAQAKRISDDVHVVVPDDPRYVVAPRRSRKVTWHVVPRHHNEYEHTRALWSQTGRTVLLLGDVYFTDAAVDTIAAGSPSAYRVYGRYRASRVTGTPYGEIFAASWGPARHAQMDTHLAEVARLRESGECTRPPGWVLLRLWQGTPVGRHVVKPPIWVEIDDWTDDLDAPADYHRHPAFGAAKARPAAQQPVPDPVAEPAPDLESETQDAEAVSDAGD